MSQRLPCGLLCGGPAVACDRLRLIQSSVCGAGCARRGGIRPLGLVARPRSPPTIRATSRRSSSVISSGPKPGIAPGALKSQSFSASPTKSRIFGIGGPRAAKRRTGQFGRHAGREEGADVGLGGDRIRSAAGSRDRTPARPARRAARRGGASLGVPRLAGARAASARRLRRRRRRRSSLAVFAASRLRRDQRARKFSGSLIRRRSFAQRRRGAPAPPDRRGRACA